MVPYDHLENVGCCFLTIHACIQPFDDVIAWSQIFDAQRGQHASDDFATNKLFADFFHYRMLLSESVPVGGFFHQRTAFSVGYSL
jgi:hypothetical protein